LLRESFWLWEEQFVIIEELKMRLEFESGQNCLIFSKMKSSAINDGPPWPLRPIFEAWERHRYELFVFSDFDILSITRCITLKKRWIGVKYSCFYCLSLFGINHEKFAGEEEAFSFIIS